MVVCVGMTVCADVGMVAWVVGMVVCVGAGMVGGAAMGGGVTAC